MKREVENTCNSGLQVYIVIIRKLVNKKSLLILIERGSIKKPQLKWHEAEHL